MKLDSEQLNHANLLRYADVLSLQILIQVNLFSYFLTGKKQSEYAEASTTQLLDVKKKDWSRSLIEKLGIPKHLFTDIVQPGTLCGHIREDICQELSIKSVPVISVAGHDTQSAMAAVPAESEDYLFISCGTWALMGTHCPASNVSEEARLAGFSNEGGFGGISLLTNIIKIRKRTRPLLQVAVIHKNPSTIKHKIL